MATLQYSGASPYVVPLPPCPPEDVAYLNYEKNLQSNSKSVTKHYGFAIFGIGRAGTIHLSFLVKERRVDLLYIVDDDRSKWEKLRNYWDLNNVKFLTSSEASIVFKDERIKAVVVASPTFTHEAIVNAALDHNKAVFCEKPLAETIQQTKALYDKAKKVNQPLLSAFNRRFDPAYRTVKERVRQGEVGRILTVKTCSRDSPLPSIDYLKTSGGIFHDCAVHDIDTILYCIGEYPTKVSAIANSNIPEIAAIDDFDTVAITLSFDSGSIGMIDLSRVCIFGYDQRLEVFGEKGMIRSGDTLPLHNVQTFGPDCIKTAPIYFSFPSRYAEGYENEMTHFIDVLEGKTELCIDPKDSLAVSKIAAACEESVRTGKVVELKWSKDELPSTRVVSGHRR